MTQIAITRAVSVSFGQCELTHQDRLSIDLDLARQQHAEYEVLLEHLGCELFRLPEQADFQMPYLLKTRPLCWTKSR